MVLGINNILDIRLIALDQVTYDVVLLKKLLFMVLRMVVIMDSKVCEDFSIQFIWLQVKCSNGAGSIERLVGHLLWLWPLCDMNQ